MNTLKESIRDYAFFEGMRPEHLAVLPEGAKSAQYKPGEVLFRQGEPANEFFLIESGKIVLESQGPGYGTTHVQTLGAGNILGWSWLFPPFLWHFQARAVEPTRVIILSGAHLLVSAERDHDFGYELMKRVAQVVIRRLQAARKQLLACQIDSMPEA